ncbi:MAG: DUF2304 domain-containing protein [Christensenella sp.]|uniref:DUF2304 domain-containing protein n=1 Tax=Christensenella sp. TaxID=1935934 RepID=UPI002B1FA657|nr:DUF2304 domain-containing protein [Christensenella sp.]MEA5001883.1 DUF2304 domain-containing protein [Christensenella sp.]
MAPILRAVLIIISILVLVYVLNKIRKAKLNIPDSIFWIVFAILLLILSVFPQIAFFFADILGIESPFNFIMLFFVGLFIIKMFLMTIKISNLTEKNKAMAQKIAFEEFSKQEKTDE